MAELNPKRAEFVRQFLVDLNGTQAAIRAGYSPKTASTQAEQLLRILEVQEAVAKGQAQKAADTGRTALDVLRDIQACTISAKQGGDLKTALRGLELEGKHFGMFTDKLALSGGLDFRGSITVRRSSDGTK